MSESDSRYSAILQNVWPPPNENTRARLERLRELEEQRRQHETPSRPRSSSLERGPSSSRELLFGSRGTFGRSSLRSSGRRSREITRSVIESSPLVDGQTRAEQAIQEVSSAKTSKNTSEDVTSNVDLLNKDDKDTNQDSSASDDQQNVDVQLHITEEKENQSKIDENKSENTVQTVSSDVKLSASGDSDLNKENEIPKLDLKKADTEIQISSGKNWEVSNDTDRKLEQISESQQNRLAKLQELENLRMQGRRAEVEDPNLSARERFNRNFNPTIRPVRQLSIREQIRNSRRARRHSDLQLSSTTTFGTKTENTSNISTRDSSGEQTVSRAINPSSWDTAFSDNNRSERMKRLKELDKMRKEGRDSSTGSFDSDMLSHRDRLQPNFSTGSLFPLSSSSINYSESYSSLLPRMHTYESILPTSNMYNRESSLFSSTSSLSRVSSVSTQDVIARAREVINTSGTAALSVNVEQERPAPPDINLAIDTISISEVVPEESSTSNTQPSVDHIQQSQVLSSIPKCQDAPLDLNHEDGATCVKALREATDNLSRTRLKTRGLPIEISDHFLADCFDPKYNFQERIALIRKKLWGDSRNVMKSERGKPDGASNTETVSKCNNEDLAKPSENTKTI